MNRQTITDDEGIPGGWFDRDKATTYAEGTDHDGSNFISKATGSQWEHEYLYHTKKGKWILHHWSQWQGSTERWTIISPSDAAAWLIRNDRDVEAAGLGKQAGEQEV